MSRLISDLLFAPADDGSGGGTIEDNALNKEEMINFLEDDGDNDDGEVLDLGKPSKESKTPKDKQSSKEKDDDDDETVDDDDEEKDDLDDLEEDLKEPDDEDLELMTPARRKDILKEFPDLFKKFPELERSYFRERKYTELLPTSEGS